jgi:DME family drug/metabolite transporter
LWPATLLSETLSNINPSGILFFILAGIMAPGVFRLFYYKGMEKVGASINASLFATHPLVGTTMAVFLLNERPTLGIWIGILCIIMGAVLIERAANKGRIRSLKIERKNLVFPLLGTLFIASSHVFRKMGLIICNEPILGTAIGHIAALCFYTLLLGFSPNMRTSLSINRQSLQLFWKAGVCLTAAWLLTFYALSSGDVSVVTPILQVQPLFIVLLVYLFLKEVEVISRGVVAGATTIIVGVVFISAF